MSLLNCEIYQLERVYRVAVTTELVLMIAHLRSDRQVQFLVYDELGAIKQTNV